MPLRLGRIAIAAIAAEALGVLVLVVLVVLFGPADSADAQPFAEWLGRRVGPISGFVLCLAGGYWVGKGAASHRVRNGWAMGLAGAALDLVIAGLLGARLTPLLLASNLGRVAAGTLGGWLSTLSKPHSVTRYQET